MRNMWALAYAVILVNQHDIGTSTDMSRQACRTKGFNLAVCRWLCTSNPPILSLLLFQTFPAGRINGISLGRATAEVVEDPMVRGR